MRKFPLFLLGALCALAFPLQAQTVLGVHLGVNIAELGGDDISGGDSRTGLNIAGSVTFPLGESLALHTGAGYSQKGLTESDEGFDVAIKLDYIEIPVLLRFAFPTEGALGVHIMGGAAIGIEASCKLEASSGSSSASVDCDDPEVDLATKTFDMGLMGGFGASLGLTDRLDLVVDLLYNLGLTSIEDSGAGADVKNRAFTLRAGVAIPVGG